MVQEDSIAKELVSLEVISAKLSTIFRNGSSVLSNPTYVSYFH